MKKSKLAGKSSVKKVSKNKKSISSLLSKSLKKPLLKKTVKLLVKMSTKGKKPQVKVKPAAKASAKPTKPVKAAPTKAVKASPVPAKAASKPAAKIVDKKGVKAAPPAPAPKELKKGAKATPVAPVVAAVLTKGAPAGKVAKPVKVAKVGSSERMCRELACENVATTKGYCRLDYIKNWKKIKRKEMILKEGKLNQYIEELVGKYPDKYIDVIRQDLSTEVNFNKVIHDLELDESIDDLDYDGDSIDALIGGIKKEIEDFGDEEF
jgi:hypothetical protein